MVAGDGKQIVPDEHPIDSVTNLPLLLCPDCKDVNFVAFTVRNRESVKLGRRFFKCPRNRQGDVTSCRRYYFEEDYVRFIINAPAMPVADGDGADELIDASVGVGDGAVVGGGESDQQAAGKQDVSGKEVDTPASNAEQGKLACHEHRVLFWLKFISMQMVMVNLLMAVVVFSCLQ